MLAASFPVLACTNFIVGKAASTDGSVIVSYSADSYGNFGTLYHFPAAMHDKDAMRDIYEWDTGKYLGKIKEAPQTYNVIGNMNEFQVTIGETTWGGRPELQDPNGLIDYGSLIYVTLQRSRSAKEAIKIMTDLVKEYGYYSSGESFSIADPDEAWILEMIGKGPDNKGAVWVAVRIPDDCIAAHANQSRIHQFNMNDKDNCLYSPDVISFAREKGYFDGLNKDFSFADAYNPLDWGGLRYCDARVWSFYNRFNKEVGAKYLPYVQGESSETMPLYIHAERKLSVQDIQEAMRDHYEGTPLDFTQDIAAGPFHMPYRLSPLSFKVDDQEYFNERPISTQQPAWTFVAQMRADLPDAIGGVLWFGNDDANMIAYTPVYCCTTKAPDCYTDKNADCVTFSFDNAFWVCNWVADMIIPRYDLMIHDLRRVQSKLENSFFSQQPGIEATAKAMYEKDQAAAKEFLTNYTNMMAQTMMKEWNDLAKYLIVKYNDGAVKKTNPDGSLVKPKEGSSAPLTRPGYPEPFKRKLIQETGDRFKVKEIKK